jgi:hypothetical protein
VTIARLLLEIRRRAAGLPHDLPKPLTIEQAAREVLGTAQPGGELDAARQVMAALLGIEGDRGFDAAILDALTPETVLRLDMMLEELLQLGRRDEAVRALRAAIIRPLP